MNINMNQSTMEAPTTPPNNVNNNVWSERLSSLKSSPSLEPKELASLEHLEDLFEGFALRLDMESGESGMFQDIANSFEDSSLLGIQVTSRSNVLDVYLPYLSALHVVYRNFSPMQRPDNMSEGSSLDSNSSSYSSGSAGDYSEGDDEVDSLTGSLATRCSVEGSVLTSCSPKVKNGLPESAYG